MSVAGNQLPPSPEQMQEMMTQVCWFLRLEIDVI
jgi:Fic family protein